MTNEIIYVITFVTKDNTKKLFNKYDTEEDAYNKLTNLIKLDPKASITYDAKTKIFCAKYDYTDDFTYYIEPITLEEFNIKYNEVTPAELVEPTTEWSRYLREKWSTFITANPCAKINLAEDLWIKTFHVAHDKLSEYYVDPVTFSVQSTAMPLVAQHIP